MDVVQRFFKISRSGISNKANFPRLSQSSSYSKEFSEKKENKGGAGDGGEEDKKSITEMLKKTELSIESSENKMAEILNNASKKLNKALVQRYTEIQKDMKNVEKNLNKMIEEVKVGDKSAIAECFSESKSDLEKIRETFVASSKVCNVMAKLKFEGIKGTEEKTMEEARDFNESIKNALQTCTMDKESLKLCFNTEKMKMQNRFNDLIQLLNNVPKNAEESAKDILKEALKCHLKAQAEAVEEFRRVLTNSKRCLESGSTRSKEMENMSITLDGRHGSKENKMASFEEKNVKLEEEICVEDARSKTKMALNMLRQDLISCNTYLIGITILGQDVNTKRKILMESQEVLNYLRKVSHGCEKAVDPFSYVEKEMSNLRTKLIDLRDEFKTKFSHIPNVSEKLSTFERCCKSAIENALHICARMSRLTNFNSLLEEAQQMLNSVGEVLTSTMQQGVEVIKNYEELANDKVSEITKEKKRELAELSAYGSSVKSCIEKSQNEFSKIEEKLRQELAACYTKHYGPLDRILSEKSTIHEEAGQIKNEIEQEIINCMSASKKTECFIGLLNTLKKKVKILSSRVGEILKKETSVRVKASKAVYECDKKAMDDACKKCNAVINDVKKCTAAALQHQ